MEKIYEDFTTKMLPEIQKGLVISKDYFLDLFGRYIKYLIVTDSVWLGISIVSLVVAITVAIVFTKKELALQYSNGGNGIIAAIFYVVSVISVATAVGNTLDLVKDVYLPEVRVYETLKTNIK